MRSGYEPTVVVDVAGPMEFSLRCFRGGDVLPSLQLRMSPYYVRCGWYEAFPGGKWGFLHLDVGKFYSSGSSAGGEIGGNLPTSLIAPISHY